MTLDFRCRNWAAIGKSTLIAERYYAAIFAHMSNTKSIPRLMTRQALARQLGLSVYSIDRAIKKSELPAYKVGGRVLLADFDVEGWLATCSEAVASELRRNARSEHKRENAGE